MKKPCRELKWITGPPVADTAFREEACQQVRQKYRTYLLGVTVRRRMILLGAVDQLNTVCPRLKPLFGSRERKDKVVTLASMAGGTSIVCSSHVTYL
jgi:hypothetical protein